MHGLLVMPTGVAVAALTFAGAAQADAQDDYLNALADKGFQMNPDTTQVYIWGGNKACDDMHNGMSPTEAKRDIATTPAVAVVHKPVGSNAALVAAMVDLAQQTLCPDTRGRSQPSGPQS